MQSLTDLDFLVSSSWVWLVLTSLVLIVVAIVLLMSTSLSDKVRGVFAHNRPHQREFDSHTLKTKVDRLETAYESLSKHLYITNKRLEKTEVQMDDLRRRLDLRSQDERQSQTRHYLGPERPSSTSSLSNHFDDPYIAKRQSSVFPETKIARSAYADIVDLYNSSRGDQSSRERFRDKYCPFFISIANDVERRRQNLPPDFRRASNGSYVAVPQGSDKAMVFPDFTLVIVDGVYEAGALGEAFDCPNYERSFSYPNFSVVQPAVFRLNGGDSWSVENKGMIELGQGQGV